MVKFNQRKESEEQKLIINFEKVKLTQTPASLIPTADVCAPKKKRVKYTQVPVEFSCRKKLF
jgi:hypothetical protein